MSRIPSLDGLRAISCAIVVLGHSATTRSLPPNLIIQGPVAEIIYNAGLGVTVFFVISGFLITSILMQEQDKTGTISLKQFYIRRSFRIFPPFYVYLLVAALLVALGVLKIPWPMFLAAGSYLWNYLHWTQGWEFGHFWSLAVEEQFYLIWPPVLLLLGQRRAKMVAAGIIVLSPAIRVASYFLFPSSRPYISIMLHTRMDVLMYGCLLALSLKDEWLEKWRRFAFRLPVLLTLGLLVAVVSPILTLAYSGRYLMTIGYSLEGVGIATLLLYAVEHPFSLFGKVLNLKWMVWLGTMSYSLYLWQQMIVVAPNPATHYPPMQFVMALAVAWLSYNLVERPALRLRDRLFPPSRPHAKAPEPLAVSAT